MTTNPNHFAEIAAIVLPALGLDPAEGLDDQQQRYFRALTIADAQAIADAALGRYDEARGPSVWNSIWHCPRMRQRAKEQLEGFEETSVCLPCYRRRSACARSNGGIFHAPEPE